jgi:hypothetical protein
MLLAHGFDAAFVGALIRSGVVEAQVEHAPSGSNTRQPRRLWLTAAGRRLLAGRY